MDIAVPPMNLLGPELVRDLVTLIQQAEADNAVRVLVFKSGDPDYFISHVDVTRIKEYRMEAAKLTGEASIALLFRYLSASRLVSIAQIEGRARGAGSEFVLACHMRFAAREPAIFSQPEPATGVSPGAGGMQHLARLMGRARALEVMLSAQDYDAELAERYGWIDRALPAKELGNFAQAVGAAEGGSPEEERGWAVVVSASCVLRTGAAGSVPKSSRLTQSGLGAGGIRGTDVLWNIRRRDHSGLCWRPG